MMSFRPNFSQLLPLTALLPLFVACGPSDGGVTVDEDDTTTTSSGGQTSGSSSAGNTSSVSGTGGGSTSGVTSGTGGPSTSVSGAGGSDPTGAGGADPTGAGGSDPTGAGGSNPTGGGDTTLVGVETPGEDCAVPNMPSFGELKAYDKLHDPFTMMDGTKVTTRAQWVCRHREISELVQHWETGPKEVKKATVKGSFAGGKLTINVSGGAQDVSFSVSISLPSTGSPPYPALIGLSNGSLDNNHLKQMGVAIINYDHNGVQPESDRSGGIFSKFHGNAESGALIAWAWGASRIIDALESTPDAQIDPKRLAITGCSRNGKGALMVGAMDSRFALTIPQESGSGGVAAWRVSEVDNKGQTGSAGVQNLTRTYGEQKWFSKTIEQFGSAVTKLPLDHHQLVSMVAPRGLLILGNLNYEWLSTNNADQAGGAARLVYEALGVKQNIGYVDSGHNHCGTDYKNGEQAAIDAFVKKFLLNDASANTDVWKPKNELDKAKWVEWTAPTIP
ncbi:glucuronyl esterase domain-containing protein [Sorangium sp. So ce381]|uniref:glucuronyl esterase domain-containing protein n=1 Tax=Sorangium sp. So ce381 TaxID=3133307 RepID=UPI003F5C9AF8